MTLPSTDNLSKDKIQQLLAAVGVKPENHTDCDMETFDYNWNQPHYFSNSQLKTLDLFTEKVAKECAAKFSQLYHCNFGINILSTTQHFSDQLFNINSDNDSDDYYIAFGLDSNNPIGILGIPIKSAIILTTHLLGESITQENYERTLSQLEESLLADIAAGLIEAFSKVYSNKNLNLLTNIARHNLPLEFKESAELCKVEFGAVKAGSEDDCEAYFLIFCNKLDSITGKNLQNNTAIPDKDFIKAIHEHLNDIPVTLKIELGQTMFNFGKIMELQAGDILILDKNINEPAKLILENKTIFHGQPAKSDGKHAIVITEVCNKN